MLRVESCWAGGQSDKVLKLSGAHIQTSCSIEIVARYSCIYFMCLNKLCDVWYMMPAAQTQKLKIHRSLVNPELTSWHWMCGTAGDRNQQDKGCSVRR